MSKNNNEIMETVSQYNQLCQRIKKYLEDWKGYNGKLMTNFAFALVMNQFGYLQIQTSFLVSTANDDIMLADEIIPANLLPVLQQQKEDTINNE